MSITSAIAVFFIIWWVCLFVVLPWGVRNSHDPGEAVAEGHEAGAPVRPMMWRKVAITTVLASAVFALVYGQMTYGWIGFEDIPFIGNMPGT
jgi:predicted secreted protein